MVEWWVWVGCHKIISSTASYFPLLSFQSWLAVSYFFRLLFITQTVFVFWVAMRKNILCTSTNALQRIPKWFRTARNQDVSTGPLARPFACLLTRPLTPHCSFHSRTPLRSFVCSLTHSRARGKVNDSMYQNDLVLSLCAKLCQ